MSEKEVAEETNAEAAVEKRTEDTDLDALLNQFEEGTKKEPVVSPPEPPIAALTKLKDQLKAEIHSEQQNAEAIKSLIKSVRGELPEDVLSDDEIQDWLDGQAKRNSELANAWVNRSKNPAAWKKIESGLSEKLNNKWNGRRIDPEATADHAAVAHAVRGASNKVTAEPPPDFSKMSNAELRKYTQENWGFS